MDIVITDELVSQPYVAMTVGLMAGFGVEARPGWELASTRPQGQPRWVCLAQPCVAMPVGRMAGFTVEARLAEEALVQDLVLAALSGPD